MEYKKTLKLRLADLPDIFQGNLTDLSKRQAIKPGTPYFTIENGVINSLQYIPSNTRCQITFYNLLVQIYKSEILVVDNFS